MSFVEASHAGYRIRSLKSDNAAEYRSRTLDKLLKNHLVQHKFTTPYVPAQNARIRIFFRRFMEATSRRLSADLRQKQQDTCGFAF